uniref:Uncharacterized protein n=1 Tax=Mycena chlorophos TaxID=658473 RepID=A0ABQ0LHS7_MYCCL|nr:predicted protein [Mycena chlorophos]
MAAIRASDAHSRLSLIAAHRLDSSPGSASTDVLIAHELVFSFSGILNNASVSPAQLLASQLAQHFVDCLRVNANELGIAPVSGLFLGPDGLPQLIITPARCSPDGPHLRRDHALLTAIHLKYIWTTTDDSDSRIHPFAPNLTLPFRLLLDNVIRRFCTWQLVKRYPLVFGSWAQQLDVERPFFKKLFRSVSRIATRSTNDSFRRKCNRRFKTMQEPHEDHELALDDEEVFSLSIELCYRNHLRRPRFKGSAIANSGLDDDNELSQDPTTPQCSPDFDEDYLWPDVAPLLPAPISMDDETSTTLAYQDPFDFWHDSDAEDKTNIPNSSYEGISEPDRGDRGAFSLLASSTTDNDTKTIYQDPYDFWHDSDAEDEDDTPASSYDDSPECGPNRGGGDELDWDDDGDVQMHDSSCPGSGSADAIDASLGPRTKLSPSAEADSNCQAAAFSGQYQMGQEDLELAFESDDEAMEPHHASARDIGTEGGCGAISDGALLDEEDWM